MAEERISLGEFIRSVQSALKSEDFTDFNQVADKFVKQAGGEGFSGFRVRRKPERGIKTCPICGKGVRDLIAHQWRAHSSTTAVGNQ